MLNQDLIELIKSHGDLSHLSLDKVEVSDAQLESVWYEGKTKVIPASAFLLATIKGMEIKCHCDVNLIIDENGEKDVCVFSQTPSTTGGNIWFIVLTADGEEDTDSLETTLEILKLIPSIHPDQHHETLKASGLELLAEISQQIDEAFENELSTPSESLQA